MESRDKDTNKNVDGEIEDLIPAPRSSRSRLSQPRESNDDRVNQHSTTGHRDRRQPAPARSRSVGAATTINQEAMAKVLDQRSKL